VASDFALMFPAAVSKLVLLTMVPNAQFAHTDLRQKLAFTYMYFFNTMWLPERLLAMDDYEFARIIFTSKSSGLQRRRMDLQDIEYYKDALAVPGALTAALSYYRCHATLEANLTQKQPPAATCLHKPEQLHRRHECQPAHLQPCRQWVVMQQRSGTEQRCGCVTPKATRNAAASQLCVMSRAVAQSSVAAVCDESRAMQGGPLECSSAAAEQACGRRAQARAAAQDAAADLHG
jgi:hypothetical protein